MVVLRKTFKYKFEELENTFIFRHNQLRCYKKTNEHVRRISSRTIEIKEYRVREGEG